MSLFKKSIIQIMRLLPEKDFEGALPYLMLTSKCEHIFRDLLAIWLRRNFHKSNAKQRYEVVREKRFRRKTVDLAILQQRSKKSWDNVAILEMKYVATATTVITGCKKLNSDLEKAKTNVKLSGAYPAYLGLLLAREAREVRPGSADGFADIIGKYKCLTPRQTKKLPGIYAKVLHEAKSRGLKILNKKAPPSRTSYFHRERPRL